LGEGATDGSDFFGGRGWGWAFVTCRDEGKNFLQNWHSYCRGIEISGGDSFTGGRTPLIGIPTLYKKVPSPPFLGQNDTSR